MRILADASLPGLDIAFPAPFIISRYNDAQDVPRLLKGQDILFCRSTLKVNNDLIQNHPLKVVATASSGTDHLDHVFLDSRGIAIIDAKGSNAVAVADYVIACIAYADQQHLIRGKEAGIIGMGHVGQQVHSRLQAAGFHIHSYDPLLDQQESLFRSCELEQLLNVDILCIHAELHDDPPHPSLDLVNRNFLAHLKPDCLIINAARGGIVNEEALLNNPHRVLYCTDVYLNEPDINSRIVDMATLCTPHIAGHSVEAKWRAIAMVSEKLHLFANLSVPELANRQEPVNWKLYREKTWQEQILSIYNPFDESRQLKQAHDKKNTFLKLRKQHQKRHDFSVYSDLTTNRQMQLLLGSP